MTKNLYKHSYRTIAAMTTALLISTSTAMVFAAETATIVQDLAHQSATMEASVESLGRFVVTPNSVSFAPSSRNQK
ncbi:MAG: hypothetical protein IPO38_05925 [Rhodocyclaceae bacterium]|nr:hypothetical protein [Rhodocyclaceae bacterium]MBP6110171.1 hypothetical protein [Rhodocyclaceae bacterium]